MGSEETRVPRNGSPGEEELAALARRLLGPNPTRGDVVAAYDAALRAMWAQLAVLIGEEGARAVFDRALQIAQAHAPAARAITFGETAFDLHALTAGGAPNAPDAPDAPDEALDALCRGCGEVVTGLIGPGLYATILRGAARQLGTPAPPAPPAPQ
jgi:hypothetical protein